MTKNIAATFDTRRDAEMAVERLVQEFGVERTDIFVAAEGDENTAGTEAAGADAEGSAPNDNARADGAHQGEIAVSVDVNDDALVEKIRGAIAEFSGMEAPL